MVIVGRFAGTLVVGMNTTTAEPEEGSPSLPVKVVTAVVVKVADPPYGVVIVERLAGEVAGMYTITAEPVEGTPLLPAKLVTAVVVNVTDPA